MKNNTSDPKVMEVNEKPSEGKSPYKIRHNG